MNTTVINIRTQVSVKKSAQKVAEELGLSLSSLINGFLKHLIKTKKVTFSVREEPSEYFIRAIKEAEEDVRKGRVSPSFTNAGDAIAWLNDPKAKYVYQLRKKVQKKLR
ncbi:type II toxin-antitoxin system RelB/DinJ family antitoxin [Candidatus Roizmanbacteria bacterium]|nr:type II toxin-antitoxin system RelB/DinJ family antitoxin [Candidatus Roizmanbacteria bacterium]